MLTLLKYNKSSSIQFICSTSTVHYAVTNFFVFLEYSEFYFILNFERIWLNIYIKNCKVDTVNQ